VSASDLKLLKNFLVKYWRMKYPLVNLKLLGNVLFVMLRDCDLMLVFCSQGVCFAFAVLLYYFQLAAFCWMMIEGINLLRGIVKVFRVTSRLRIYSLSAWGKYFLASFIRSLLSVK